MSELTEFYALCGTDHAGRGLKDYWLSTHEWREMTHDYIQWAFPLPVASQFNPNAPIMTIGDLNNIHSCMITRASIECSVRMMSVFYTECDDWLQPQNHNHMRITRILKSLRVMAPLRRSKGLDVDFYALIVKRARHGRINPTTRAIWADIVGRERYDFEDARKG